MKSKIAALLVGLFVASGFAFADDDVLPDPLPTEHTHTQAPATPSIGQHKHKHHGKRHVAAVRRHARISCDHLSHRFIGTLNHQAFIAECQRTHTAVMTHLPPHPDGLKDQ